ncbi:MAG TPA: hypothetical protein VFH34_15075 [Anaerolineales bacterium]|nr:hypothetical protein [Anaerolineales bacterium]
MFIDAAPEDGQGIFVTGNKSKSFSFPGNWTVIGILFVSLILRWILILRGGQYYISDETRYEVSLAAARLLWQGQFGEALRQFTVSPEHLGFKVVGTLPALTEYLIGPSLVVPAIFFSFFSILNLYLIFLLSRRSQISPNESIYALFFAASCLSLLYYSRHLFPYDMAMSFGLMALYIALDQNPTMKLSLVCGGLSFLCFITYNGYWPLAGFAMLAHVLIHSKRISNILQKGILTAFGFITSLIIVILAMLWSGTDMISAYRLFASSITQGVFEEGWSLPFEYFWHTEYAIILILTAMAILALASSSRNQRKYTWLWAGGILFIYLCLVIPSMLEYFVVYARLARQMIPFLILLAAPGLIELEKRIAYGYGARVPRLIVAIAFLQAVWNFYTAYQVNFPRDFAAEVQTRFPDFEFSAKRLAFGAPVICQDSGYMVEHTKFYVAPPEEVPHVEGQLLLSALHPTNYQPYLYEGDSPDFRKAYRNLKLRMSFYKANQEFMSETNPAWTRIESCVTAEE